MDAPRDEAQECRLLRGGEGRHDAPEPTDVPVRRDEPALQHTGGPNRRVSVVVKKPPAIMP